MPEVPGSIPIAVGDVQYPFFFLAENNFDDSEKIS